MSTRETRILHLHIPKTAGTAIKIAVMSVNGSGIAVFPRYDEAGLKTVPPDDYDFYSGHFGYSSAAAIGGRMITVLRDPIDRFVSVYYFWRQLHEREVERNRKTALAVNYSLHDFATLQDELFLSEEFFNRCTWQLAHGSSIQHRQALHDQGVTERQVLDRARDNLANFAAVGFQDDIAPFNAAVNRLFGLNLLVRRVNVTQGRVAVADVPAATRRLIERWCYLDIELYQQARHGGIARTA
jgi:hypothetical protein